MNIPCLSVSMRAHRESSNASRTIALLSSSLLILSWTGLGSPNAHASAGDPVDSRVVIANLAHEDQLIATVRQAARFDNDSLVDSHLGSVGGLAPGSALSAALARRAAGVCGWLQSDNDHARAERLARRTIQWLASLAEGNDADRLERIYWEAWLQGYVLDDKVRALELLRAAARLAPDDLRIASDAVRWEQALAEFGR